MANWVADFLAAHPDAAARIVKRSRNSLHLRRDDGLTEARFTGAPMHWWDGAAWQAIDTSIVDLGNGYWGAAGLVVRINKADRTVEIVGSDGTSPLYSQRTGRVAVLRPSTMALRGTPVSIPAGTRSADAPDSLVASGVIGGANWEHRLQLTESGIRETLTLATKPTLSGVVGTDYLILETAISGQTFPDGPLDEFAAAGGTFPAPHAHDALGDAPDCRRYARTVSGTQYVYTGIPISWLATAQYPVIIDPDYAGSLNDGYVEGSSTVYATAQSTATTHNLVGAGITIGQSKVAGTTFLCDRAFLAFDASGIGGGNTVTQVNLKLAAILDGSSNADFNVQIVKADWSASDPLSTGTRQSAFALALSATLDDSIWRSTAGMGANTQYTSGNLATAWVNVTGTTYYALTSSRDRAGNVPSAGNEYIQIASQNHSTTAYRPVLTVLYSSSGVTLTVDGAAQAQAADGLALTQAHTLTVAGAAQAQSATSPTLTQAHRLAVDGATQASSADTVALVQAQFLAVAGATQAQTVPSVALSVAAQLAVTSATHAQTADALTLRLSYLLALQNAAQAQTAGEPLLVQSHLLAVASTLHAQTVEAIALTQAHQLAINGATQAQMADGAYAIRDLGYVSPFKTTLVSAGRQTSTLAATGKSSSALADSGKRSTGEVEA